MIPKSAHDLIARASERIRQLQSAHRPVSSFFPTVASEDREFIPEAVELIAYINGSPELQGVLQEPLTVPGAINVTDAFGLAHWLVQRALDHGTQMAIDDVETYLSASQIRIQGFASIIGLRLSRKCEITDAARLVPIEEVRQTVQLPRIKKLPIDRMVFPTAALVRDITIVRHSTKPEAVDRYLFSNPDHDVDDIILCAGLLGPTGPYVDAWWWEIPSWVPCFRLGCMTSSFSFQPISEQWPDDAYSLLPDIYEAFCRLPSNERDRLRIPLERLNSSMHPLSMANAAIDCRVALEAIFLSDLQSDHGELSYRICLRAAKYLGRDVPSRRRLLLLAKDLYRRGSVAVHSGVVKQTAHRQAARELFEGCSLIADALRRHILQGAPNWETIDLS